MWPGLWLSLRTESELSVYMVRVQLVGRVRSQYVTMASAQPMTRFKVQCLAGITTQNVHQIKNQSGNMTGDGRWENM